MESKVPWKIVDQTEVDSIRNKQISEFCDIQLVNE
jgi:hypothetical protein